MTPKFSVILPTYNERDGINPLVKAIIQQLKDYSYEIIVVDDHSPDGTFTIVQEADHKNMILIDNVQRLGLAKSIRRGVEKANGQYIIIMDSDFNHNPSYIEEMVSLSKEYDVVSASRFMDKAFSQNNIRHVLTHWFNCCTRWILGGRLTDYFYGFSIINRQSLQVFPLDKIFYGYGDYQMRLLSECERRGLRIKEVSAVNGERLYGEGNKALGQVAMLYIIEVFKQSVCWKNYAK